MDTLHEKEIAIDMDIRIYEFRQAQGRNLTSWVAYRQHTDRKYALVVTSEPLASHILSMAQVLFGILILFPIQLTK